MFCQRRHKVKREFVKGLLYKFEKGSSSRSHGVHVARLSGLPESLLELAARKSEEMEAQLKERHLLQLLGSLAAATTPEEAEATWRMAQALGAQ